MRNEREGRRLPNWAIGLVLVVVIAVASVLAFTKEVPWGDKFEVRAVFGSAQNLRPSSPVRIAGVEVGKVTSVEPLIAADADTRTAQAGGGGEPAADAAPGQQAAVVTMELEDNAMPVHEDATFKLRPRLFLEGNYFVDMQPGSPNARSIDDGWTFPINQTSYSVQLDEVLTTLQGDVRADLQVFLNQLGNALTKYHGADGFREVYRTSAPAFKYTSEVNQAVLGRQPGDLTGVIRGLDRVVRGLGSNEQALQDLVANFRVFSGSFAAEDEALGRSIELLPDVLRSAKPAFASLNAAFPAVRAFAREALPGVRSTPETLAASTPFVEQVRLLVSKRELRGLTADLRPTIPRLAELADRSVSFFDQARALSSCFNEVVIPWSEDTVQPIDPSDQYPSEPVGRVFEETAYGLEGIASESRSGDANGQYIRVAAGGGANTVKIPDALPNPDGLGLQDAVGLTAFPILGAMPKLTDSAKTPFRPNKPCERQEPPNLQAGAGAGPETASAPQPDPADVLSSATRGDIRAAADQFGLTRQQTKPLIALGRGGN